MNIYYCQDQVAFIRLLMLTCEVSSLLGDYHFKLLLRKIQGQCKSDFGKIDILASSRNAFCKKLVTIFLVMS